MSAQEMKTLRRRAGLGAAEMAERMGLGEGAYVELERDTDSWAAFKPRHQLALERASLKLAVERGDLDLALPEVRRDVLDLVTLARRRH